MEQSSPSPSIVAAVPVSAQSTPTSVHHESGHLMEELPRSSPKAPAVSAPVFVPAQSVTVSAASATVTVCASPVTVPVSAIASVAPVTVTAPAMEQSSPSESVVASVPISAQSNLSSFPNDSGHVMEEFSHSRPKAPAVSAPVFVPAQSVTVSAAYASVTVSASPVTVPVSGIVSAAPVTVTGSVSPAIFYRTCFCYSYRFLCYGYRYCPYYSYCACSYL